MPASSPSPKKALPTAIAGVLIAIVAGALGLNLSSHDSPVGKNDSSHTPVSTSAVTASQTQEHTAAPTKKPSSKNTSVPASGLSSCTVDSLPKEAEETITTILSGGPFPHPDNDGVRFGNYEGLLPRQSRNYYREYTVDTPGLRHRGERRVITGGGSPRDPDTWYYTDDHYESFCEIPDAE
ncbi:MULTISPECIES: ribonuclease domain-containing protein [Corynebacterium]|uniref:Guanyl-specific ribonuclease Sa3 n=1 Tax=Corynebacterium ramonii TaxID=3026968 RepID=A0ABM5RT74_9CORY|nr:MULTISPECIES: ribonuclease domain-containing protein [Corynebacterium]AIU33153.1 Guanyl-specific ribonuclease Sa3 [Corynebacterium ramonii FRC0011]AIU92228.1 Guanyl-specific ribonuclease Sa3 [Corynebacterium ulcerans]ESU57968.1 ribonuclease [Corynebacterium ulcerans NCTC 12077]STC83470.1 Guanyl-specific ribonuclease Sa3 [Corynebacterium ulcerans]